MASIVEILWRPAAYSQAQIRRAIRIAYLMGRGKLVLVEAPAHCPECLDEPETFCTKCGRS